MDEREVTSIPEVFRGKSVLVTGVTGFVGKVLLEKLVRCCPGLDRVYVIVRPKKGDGVKERIRELLGLPFFDRCRSERGSITWRCGTAEDKTAGTEGGGSGDSEGPVVVGLAGDVSQLGLGLTCDDRAALESRVSVVFHVAATVRFNDPLREAVLLNTRGTREMLALARCMVRLEAFVHVSTAYAHVSTFKGEMQEQFYGVPMEPGDLIKAAEELDDERFQMIADEQAKFYHNTYLCTKALAERIIEKDYRELPVSVFRPGIVLSTHREPLPGWSEGFQGPSVCIVGAITGMVVTFLCDGRVKPELVPVDHVVNTMLSIAWASVVDGKDGRRSGGVPIYNFVSSKVNRMDWNKMQKVITRVLEEMPEASAMYKKVHFTRSNFLYNSSSHLRQYLAKLLDFTQSLRGKTSRAAMTQKKIKAGIDSLVYFMNNEFNFSDVNLRSLLERVSREGAAQRDFDFDVSRIDWDDYLRCYVRFLGEKTLLHEVRGRETVSERTQLFHLLFSSMKVVAAIFSSVSLYFISTYARALFVYYVALRRGNT